MCFEVLGFDIIIDDNLKPWLLEINHTPAFATDTPLDYKIKYGVVKEALQLMDISAENRRNWKIELKARFEQRMFTRSIARVTPAERVVLREEAKEVRKMHEDRFLRNYDRIYPVSVCF